MRSTVDSVDATRSVVAFRGFGGRLGWIGRLTGENPLFVGKVTTGATRRRWQVNTYRHPSAGFIALVFASMSQRKVGCWQSNTLILDNSRGESKGNLQFLMRLPRSTSKTSSHKVLFGDYNGGYLEKVGLNGSQLENSVLPWGFFCSDSPSFRVICILD